MLPDPAEVVGLSFDHQLVGRDRDHGCRGTRLAGDRRSRPRPHRRRGAPIGSLSAARPSGVAFGSASRASASASSGVIGVGSPAPKAFEALASTRRARGSFEQRTSAGLGVAREPEAVVDRGVRGREVFAEDKRLASASVRRAARKLAVTTLRRSGSARSQRLDVELGPHLLAVFDQLGRQHRRERVNTSGTHAMNSCLSAHCSARVHGAGEAGRHRPAAPGESASSLRTMSAVSQ